MSKFKKYKAVVMITIIFLIQIITATSYATITPIGGYDVYKEVANTGLITYEDGKIGFVPHDSGQNGWTYYCLQKGAHYNASMPRGDAQPGKQVEKAEGEAAPTGGNSMTYVLKGQIDTTKYQDLAYVIASAAERNMLHDKETQLSIWASSINTQINHGAELSNKGLWGEEATKFQNFYNEVHMWNGTNYTDIYSSRVNEYDTNKMVHVDYSTNTYIVGPYKINYPQGNFNDQIWSYISNISILNQNNAVLGTVKDGKIQIVDVAGNKITDLKGNNFPKTEEEFYIKFNSSLMPKDSQGASTVTSIRVKVDFTYLESCSGIMYEYIGHYNHWSWTEITTDTITTTRRRYELHYEEVVDYIIQPEGAISYGTYNTIYEDENGTQTVTNEVMNYGWSGEASGDIIASKKWKTTSIIMSKSKIDMTMDIEGYTFLDQDSGKVNTGDNIKQNSEALEGVEVELYYADGDTKDQLVRKASQIATYHTHTEACYTTVPHTHVGSALTGGGCYTHRTDHVHKGDQINGGECYAEAIKHVHIGSPITGGGCYTKPVYHTHTEACYESTPHTHTKTGNLESMGTRNVEVECVKYHCFNTISWTGTEYVGHWGYGHTLCGQAEEYEESVIKSPWGGGLYIEYATTTHKATRSYTPLKRGCYHVHTDACYTTVLHVHTESCYDENGTRICGFHSDRGSAYFVDTINPDKCYEKVLICDLDENTPICGQTDEVKLTCGKNEGQIEGYELGCGLDNYTYGYNLTCTEPMYDTLYCKKTEDKILTCGKSVTDGTIGDPVPIQNATITDKSGHYSFAGLDPMRKYYVKFVYNGMLYTNVAFDQLNTLLGSKATETETSRYDYRTPFNNKFAEIGSYPSNYKITNKVFGDELGDYNKTYLQEDIADIFKSISEKMVNQHTDDCTAAARAVYHDLEGRYGSQEEKIELKRKIQFAVDCRIQSQTVRNYPLTDKFTISTVGKTINGAYYYPIYSGTYDQLHVNLGIKALETFDLSLYKDVLKAEVSINGKTETYNYDSRKSSSPFKLGVSEEDYLNGLRNMYQNNGKYYNDKQTWGIDRDSYNLNMRTEEIANGNPGEYYSDKTKKVDGNYQVNDNYNLTGEDRLKIKVTYKIAIRNESSTLGAITELVDYYDTNYNFIRAYVGDKDGNENTSIKVEWSEESKYNKDRGDTQYKSTKGTYKTMYIRPEEVVLKTNSEEVELENYATQYVFVVLELVGPSGDAGTLLTNKLLENNSTLNTMNLVEINGYKTYNNTTRTDGGPTNARGLIDIDSNPGNLNISNIDALTQNNIVNYPNIRAMYEDDTNRAPVLIYKTTNSKTIDGIVFEDSTGKTDVVTGEKRSGNGILDSGETGIRGVIVELIEIKGGKKTYEFEGEETQTSGEMIIRARTTTNEYGWYGFTGFIPGDYVIRYTYGSNNDTAMTAKTGEQFGTEELKGKNDKSYNGQDYKATTFTSQGNRLQELYFKGAQIHRIDYNMSSLYGEKNTDEEQSEQALYATNWFSSIYKYEHNPYWYTNTDTRYSDADDDAERREKIKSYSNDSYGVKIINHKAEVFNSYMNPQPEHILLEDNKKLANELEKRTWCYAYTPIIEVEVEYATKTTTGKTNESNEFIHKITNVDFGIVERPKSELTIDQDIKQIKVTLADGRVLFDAENDGKGEYIINKLLDVSEQNVKSVENIQWIARGEYDKLDKNELMNIIMDEELINGATIEITYNITVKNNSEAGTGTTRAENILNYVANNLTFDAEDNLCEKGYPEWEVVSKDDIQNDKNSTLVNNKVVDLSTQSVILRTTWDNPLRNPLGPGEQVTSTLKLKKVLSTESSTDDLTYTNMSEIVEIDNTDGRYDHEATPGNQKLELQPMEHDTSGASKYTTFDDIGQPDNENPPDGVIIVTPPTGSNYIYYVIGITGALILAVGIFLIKKFVIDKKK